WSARQDLTAVALTTPNPVGPLGWIASTTPVFSWAPVPGASRYAVWVDDLTSGASQVLFSSQVTTPMYQDVAHPLAAGHSYRWWVQAIDHLGNASPWSAAAEFTVL